MVVVSYAEFKQELPLAVCAARRLAGAIHSMLRLIALSPMVVCSSPACMHTRSTPATLHHPLRTRMLFPDGVGNVPRQMQATIGCRIKWLLN